jgi:hypothetical protein
LYKPHKRPSTTIWPGNPDRTLALGAYWDYDPFIDARLRPLRDGDPHSFPFFLRRKEYDARSNHSGLYTTLINLSPMAYRERKERERERERC